MADLAPAAVVVGSGPNGLAAAIALARAGKSVQVIEAAEELGGGTRSAPLTLPGFIHDVCSSVQPLAVASPFFKTLPLREHGLDFVDPPIPLAHPLDDGTAAALHRSLADTAQGLGVSGATYGRLMGPLVRGADALLAEVLRPLRPTPHALLLARFGLPALSPVHWLAGRLFKDARARAMFAGLGAHSMLSLRQPGTSAFALMLAVAGHAYGWPFARGGSQRIHEAMSAILRQHGGTTVTGLRVTTLEQAMARHAVLFDLTPRQVAAIGGDQLPAGFTRTLGRFRYGCGVYKLDWALDGPIPWTAAACRQAGTVHCGGTLEEVVAAEDAVARGQTPAHPFVILAQPTVADPSRAPAGKHVGWAYCHVPNGSTADMTERIEAQVERFAPGFRARILARHVMTPADVERHNANYVGGDINGGAADLRQLFLRPTRQLYATPNRRLYICSSSTPPGGGVHGMCGALAARAALRRARWR